MLVIADLIDGNTLIIVNALLSAVTALVLYIVYLGSRNAPGLLCWALSNLCFAVGFASLFAFYWKPLPYIDTLGANLLIDVGAILAYVAVLQFLGRPRRELWPIVPAAILIAVEVVRFVNDGVDMSAMVPLGATARAIVTFAAGWQLLRHAEPQMRPGSTVSAVFHFVWVAMLLSRVIWWLFAGYDEVDWDPTTAAALISRILLTFVVTPSYLWMLTRVLDFELMKQAREDALTGVANRRAIWDQAPITLATTARRGKSACLLMMDVDFFKSVNDRFGHAVGDAVLVGIASKLSSHVRQQDMVARVGGEEFMVLLSDIDVENAANLAERLREAIESHEFSLPGGDVLRCTVSIGMSMFAGEARSWEGLVQDADNALYCAKRLGRNRVEQAPPYKALVPA